MATLQRLVGGTLAAVLASAMVGLGASAGQAAAPPPALTAEPPPDLSVNPTSGPAGSTVVATATGYGSCFPTFDDVGLGAVTFRWRDDDQTWTSEIDGDTETATATITVPADFGPGPQELLAWCASDDSQRSEASFTVPETPPEPVPGLDLDPTAGPAGSGVEATATGYDRCFPTFDDVGLGTVVLRWEGDEETWLAEIDDSTGTAITTVTVPAGFGAGSHDLVARCASDDALQASASYAVQPGPPDQPERLRLTPDTGPAGTTTTATATGYECDGDVVFLSAGDEFARAGTGEDGRATARLTIPVDARPGQYAVLAQCETDGAESARAPFTVSVRPDQPERLILDPPEGPRGTTVTARATGFECPGDVVVLAEGDTLTRAAAREDGTATAGFTVPDDARPGRYPIVAQCETDGTQSAAAPFTVTPGTSPEDDGGDGSDEIDPVGWLGDRPWWPVAVLLAVLLAATLLRARHHRTRPHGHVSAVAGAAAATGVLVDELPTDPSVRDVVVRIEPHADPGTQTMEEGDP